MGKEICGAWLVLAIFLVLAGRASATVVTINVTGVVNSIDTNGGFVLDGSVVIDSIMTGFCTYDTDTPDEDPSEDKGYYPIISISMTIGNYTFTHDPMSTDSALFNVGYDNGWIYRVDSASPRFDGTIYVDGSPKTFDDITWEEPYGEVKLMDVWTSSDGIITSTELPTSFPDISVFDLRREFWTGFVEPSTVPNGGGFLIEGDLTYLGVVPEPATVLLLALGGLALLRKSKINGTGSHFCASY